jgi:hypothetical protein
MRQRILQQMEQLGITMIVDEPVEQAGAFEQLASPVDIAVLGRRTLKYKAGTDVALPTPGTISLRSVAR